MLFENKNSLIILPLITIVFLYSKMIIIMISFNRTQVIDIEKIINQKIINLIKYSIVSNEIRISNLKILRLKIWTNSINRKSEKLKD